MQFMFSPRTRQIHRKAWSYCLSKTNEPFFKSQLLGTNNGITHCVYVLLVNAQNFQLSRSRCRGAQPVRPHWTLSRGGHHSGGHNHDLERSERGGAGVLVSHRVVLKFESSKSCHCTEQGGTYEGDFYCIRSLVH